MNDYSHIPNLYEEILLDYHYRFPKFHPIPYYNETQSLYKRDRNTEQKTNKRSTEWVEDCRC